MTAQPFPRLSRNNASIGELREWLEGERRRLLDLAFTSTDLNELMRIQGRGTLVQELLRNVDPNHRQYGERG